MERLLRKLRQLVPLDPADERALAALPASMIRIARRRDLLRAFERPGFLYVMMEGWAARYGLRADGSRRITGLLLPGDLCGIHAVTGAALDHSILALTDCEVGQIKIADIQQLVTDHPAFQIALWRAKLVDEAILRKWLLNSSDSAQAVAHLMCELSERAVLAGVGDGTAFDMPLTQEEIGDVLGITSVHTNRVLQRLRREGLIEGDHGRLTILDRDGLRRFAEFSPNYLKPWDEAAPK